MSRLEERLREADRIPVEDRWAEIRDLTPARPPVVDSRRPQRWVAVSVGIAAGVVAIALITVAFRGTGRSHEVNNGLQQLPLELRPIGYANVRQTAYSVAADGGSVWVATYDFKAGSAAVVRFDAPTTRIVATIPIDGHAYNLAAGAGAVWVPTGNPQDGFALDRIDESTNQITGRVPGVTGPVAVGASGVWAVDGTVLVSIDPQTLVIRSRTRLPEKPLDIAANGGTVWVLESGTNPDHSVGPGPLIQIDASTGTVVRTVDLQTAGLWIAADAYGVWVNGWVPGDPNRAAGFFVPASGGSPQEVADVQNFIPLTVGAGRLWFVRGAEAGGADVCGLDISTGDVDPCAHLSSLVDTEAAQDPGAFDASTGTLWISEYESSRVAGFKVETPGSSTPRFVLPTPPECPGRPTMPSDSIKVSTISGNRPPSLTDPCIYAPANRDFRIVFSNRTVATDGSHVPQNLSIYASEEDALSVSADGQVLTAKATNAIFRGRIVLSPRKVTYDVPALAPGTYWIQSDYMGTRVYGILTVS
jgi:hypothetical protein